MSKTSRFARTLAVTLAIGVVGSTTSISAVANADVSTEERFQDLFVTAGYSAAFGAALGAAFLAFEPNPSEKLQYISIGASLGFIGGSVAGTYIIFQPMFGDKSNGEQDNMLAGNYRQGTLALKPWFDTSTRSFNRVDGSYTILTF